MDGMARQGRGDTTMRRTQQSRQEFLRDAADILQREWGGAPPAQILSGLFQYHELPPLQRHAWLPAGRPLPAAHRGHSAGCVPGASGHPPRRGQLCGPGGGGQCAGAHRQGLPARAGLYRQPKHRAEGGHPLPLGTAFAEGPQCRVRQRSQDCLRHHQEGCLALLGYLHAGARPAPQDAELRA